jgi:hypothetical protein
MELMAVSSFLGEHRIKAWPGGDRRTRRTPRVPMPHRTIYLNNGKHVAQSILIE